MGSQFCIPASDPGHILYQPSLSPSLCSQRTAPRTRALSGQTGLTYTLHMFHVYSFIQEHSNKYYLLMAKNFVQFILQCFSLKVIFQDICKIFAGVYRMRTAEIGLLHFIELFTPRRLLLAAGCWQSWCRLADGSCSAPRAPSLIPRVQSVMTASAGL